MSSEQTKILILEDDETVGMALKEALSRAGYHVFLAGRPDEANEILSINNDMSFVFADCLLPQMTGIDFINQARVKYPRSTFKVILMSGIYTDKNFIQESTRGTKAISFLKKPFEMEQVLKLVKKEEPAERREDASVVARKLLYQMFANSTVSNRQKRKVIESIEEVSGFDLPFLYSLLVETKSSGYLNIYNSDGSVSGISFCNGNIVGVDVDDKTTFIGEMLIQSGYALPKDVQGALRDKDNRRLGNYLIQNNQLSPHAFDIILLDQLNIRLSRTVVDHKSKVNFAASEVEMRSPSIDADTLSVYLHDWIASKISVSWLKAFYIMWSGNTIVTSQTFREDHPALNMSLVQSLDGLLVRLNNQMTLSQLLEVKDYNEVAVYKAVHFLLTKGLIVFAQRNAFSSPQEQLKALQKMHAEIQGKNSFEIVSCLGITVDSAGGANAIDEFMAILGECPVEDKTEAFKLWNKISSVVREAVLASEDSNKLDQFKQATQKSEAEGKLRAASLLEDAKKALQLNQYSKAQESLVQIEKLGIELAQFRLYNSWAKTGVTNPTRKAAVIKEIELELVQVPPDERYDALFPFVVGLVLKLKGDTAGAIKSFEKSIALDGSFIPARRHLGLLMQVARKPDVFNMDLKQVVSGFFKRR